MLYFYPCLLPDWILFLHYLCTTNYHKILFIYVYYQSGYYFYTSCALPTIPLYYIFLHVYYQSAHYFYTSCTLPTITLLNTFLHIYYQSGHYSYTSCELPTITPYYIFHHVYYQSGHYFYTSCAQPTILLSYICILFTTRVDITFTLLVHYQLSSHFARFTSMLLPFFTIHKLKNKRFFYLLVRI